MAHAPHLCVHASHTCSLPEGGDMETPMLAGGESYEWAAVGNLDVFFTRLYR